MKKIEVTHCDKCPVVGYGSAGTVRCGLYPGTRVIVGGTRPSPPDWCPLRAGAVQLRLRLPQMCGSMCPAGDGLQCGLVDGHRLDCHLARVGDQEISWGEHSRDELCNREHEWWAPPVDPTGDSELDKIVRDRF